MPKRSCFNDIDILQLFFFLLKIQKIFPHMTKDEVDKGNKIMN